MDPVADFLSGFPPFDQLEEGELEDLAKEVEVEYFPADQVILRQREASGPEVWVVRTGAVDLIDEGRVLDRLEEGEMFGHPSMLSGLPTTFEVRAAEDCLCYRLMEDRLVPLFARPAGLRYLSRSLMARPRPGGPPVGPGQDPAQQPASSLIRHEPVVCDPDSSVRTVAKRMAEAEASAALVRLDDGDLGIVTDSDIRSRVVAGGLPEDSPVSEAMTAPAFAVGPDTPGTDVMLEMLDRGIRHVPVRSAFGDPMGVLVAVELLATQAHAPFALRREIEAAGSAREVREAAGRLRSAVIALSEAEAPPAQISGVIAVVADTLTRRLIELALEELGEPPAPFSWLAFGSLGRREMSPGSDIDSALTWSGPEDPEIERYMVDLGGRVVEGLADCGFKADTHGATAGQPFFVRSADAWRAALRRAIEQPGEDKGLILLSLALDGRVIHRVGDPSDLPEELRRLDHLRALRRLMLSLALAHKPPTGFLRDFVVEHSGEHRGQLDIKRGGLLPVTDLARYACLAAGARAIATPERLRVASIAGALDAADARMLDEAFDLYSRLRIEHQVEQLRQGEEPDDFMDPEELDALTRRYLRDAFHAVRSLQRKLDTQRRFE